MQLETAGFSAYALDLSRSVCGIPVVRVISPGLEMGLAAPPGPRLCAVAARHGVDPAVAPVL